MTKTIPSNFTLDLVEILLKLGVISLFTYREFLMISLARMSEMITSGQPI